MKKQRHREQSCVLMKETGGLCLQGKEYKGLPAEKEEAGKDSSSQPSEEQGLPEIRRP